jgi:hypothetical protein
MTLLASEVENVAMFGPVGGERHWEAANKLSCGKDLGLVKFFRGNNLLGWVRQKDFATLL